MATFHDRCALVGVWSGKETTPSGFFASSAARSTSERKALDRPGAAAAAAAGTQDWICLVTTDATALAQPGGGDAIDGATFSGRPSWRTQTPYCAEDSHWAEPRALRAHGDQPDNATAVGATADPQGVLIFKGWQDALLPKVGWQQRRSTHTAQDPYAHSVVQQDWIHRKRSLSPTGDLTVNSLLAIASARLDGADRE